MKLYSYLLMAAILLTGMSSCRKGPEDPLLSFTTRKNRLSKNWVAYEYFIDGANQLNTSETVNYNVGDCGTQTVKTDKTLDVKMNFSKSGSYSDSYSTSTHAVSTVTNGSEGCSEYSYDINESNEDAHVGYWNFSGGVGNTSSREQVFIYQEETQMGYLWDIVRLAGDELKLKRKYIQPGQSTFTVEEINFKPK